jgi:DNA-binding transcriptional LysR family regulator
MQFESLQVFCDVVRHRSFSKAAMEHDVTQSAVSQMMMQLEKRLGVRLIDRSTRPLQLTPPGQIYYEGCKELIEQFLDLEASIRIAQSDLPAVVQVAAIYSVGLGDMGQLLERFQSQEPNTRIGIEYLHPDRVVQRVLDGAADLGLVSFPRPSRKLTILPWRDEPMVLVCPPGHRLAEQSTIRPSDLAGEKYVGFDRNLQIRKEVDRFLREHGVAVDVVMEFDNIENIKKAIEVSAGVALLPEPTLTREVEAGSLQAVPLSGARLVRPLAIIHRRQPGLGAAAARFVQLLLATSSASPSSKHKRPGRTRWKRTGRLRPARNGSPTISNATSDD